MRSRSFGPAKIEQEPPAAIPAIETSDWQPSTEPLSIDEVSETSESVAMPIQATIEDYASANRRISRVIAAAVLASVVWLALIAAAIYLLAIYQLPDTLIEWAGVVAGATAPLCLVWLVALVASRPKVDALHNVLVRIHAVEAHLVGTAGRTRHEISTIENRLVLIDQHTDALCAGLDNQASKLRDVAGELEQRMAGLSGSLARDRETIEQLLARLDTGSTAARNELAGLIETLPQVEAQAAAVGNALNGGAGNARAQVAEIEAMLAAIRTRNEETQAQIADAVARLTATIQTVEAASRTATTNLSTQAEALNTNVDSALVRTEQAFDTVRAGVEAQTSALLASAEQARVILDDAGNEASRAVAKRLDHLTQQAEQLTAQLNAQDANSRALVETIERNFSVLDAKLANAAQTSTGTLDRLSERLDAVREQIHALATPLDGTREATREIETAMASLHAAASQTIDMLGRMLPDSVGRTMAAVETIRSSVATVMADMTQLHDGASRVAEPVENAHAMIGTALGDLAAQRDTMEAAVSRVTDRLAEAKTLAAEVDATTDAATLTATTKLVEAMSRVHEVANQAAGAMRTTLDGVIAEMQDALAAASAQTAQNALGEPIKAQLAEIEAASERSAAAGQAVAERLSRQLVTMAEAAASVEARIAEVEVRLDEAGRDELSRRSGLLIEALNSASIDIAKVLSNDVSDPAWQAYMRGDRGVFTRRAVKLLDSRAARNIARLYAKETEFRDSVLRYIADFEALMRRVMADRDGGPLSTALLSSDVGKLYVALAQATERLRP